MGNLLGLEHITTKPGGRDFACVMYLNFIRLPLGAGGGWAATISLSQMLSGDVATLLFQILWAFIISLFNRYNPRPFFAETVTNGAPRISGNSR